MRVVVCGARGSTPAPGAAFLRYGGHTSCVALAHDGERDPSLVLDAGTGLQVLSEQLQGRPFRGSLLLGHLHWDHTHGLPFFAAGGQAGARVRVLVPDQGEDPEQVLERAFSPPHFPVPPSALGEDWGFRGLAPGRHDVEGFRVLALDIPHKGGRTFGYRVDDGRSSVAYLSDHSPTVLGPGPDGLGARHEAAVALVRDVDVLLHDAQHTASQFPGVAYLGHASAEYALALAEEAGAGRLLLFHHDSRRTDDEVDAVVASLQGGAVQVDAAAEGAVLELGTGDGAPVPDPRQALSSSG